MSIIVIYDPFVKNHTLVKNNRYTIRELITTDDETKNFDTYMYVTVIDWKK